MNKLVFDDTSSKNIKPDKNILMFIQNFYENGDNETIRYLFRCKYCYYFSIILKEAFPDGEVCWAAPFGHIVFVKDDIPYDIEGTYLGESCAFVPVKCLGDAIFDFMHIPGKAHNTTKEELTYFIEKYVDDDLKEYTLSLMK